MAEEIKGRVETQMRRALDWLEATDPADWQPAHWYWLKEFHQALTRPTAKPEDEQKPNWSEKTVDEICQALRDTMQKSSGS